MHGMHPFNAIIVFDPTGSARRLIMAFDKLRHQVRDREYRPQYEEKLAMAARHPEVWVKRLADVEDILYDTEKWLGRDISALVDVVRRKHAEIMERTCPPGIKLDLAEASKTKVDGDAKNEKWAKVLAVVQKNVKAEFPGLPQKDVDGVKVVDFKQEESFDMSMVDADAADQDTTDVLVEKVKEEETLDTSMMDFEEPASDTLGDNFSEVSAAIHQAFKAHAPVLDGFKSHEVVAASRTQVQSPPTTPVTKRKRKSSEVGDIETDAETRDREPDAAKADESMGDANGGEVGEVRLVGKETKRKQEDDPTEDAEFAELDKVQGGSYSCTAL